MIETIRWPTRAERIIRRNKKKEKMSEILRQVLRIFIIVGFLLFCDGLTKEALSLSIFDASWLWRFGGLTVAVFSRLALKYLWI